MDPQDCVSDEKPASKAASTADADGTATSAAVAEEPCTATTMLAAAVPSASAASGTATRCGATALVTPYRRAAPQVRNNGHDIQAG